MVSNENCGKMTTHRRRKTIFESPPIPSRRECVPCEKANFQVIFYWISIKHLDGYINVFILCVCRWNRKFLCWRFPAVVAAAPFTTDRISKCPWSCMLTQSGMIYCCCCWRWRVEMNAQPRQHESNGVRNFDSERVCVCVRTSDEYVQCGREKRTGGTFRWWASENGFLDQFC